MSIECSKILTRGGWTMLVSPSWTSVKPGRGRVRSFKGGSITTTGTGGISCHQLIICLQTHQGLLWWPSLWVRSTSLAESSRYYYWPILRKESTCSTSNKKYILYSAIQVIGAHTDSPVLKVKPVSAKTANSYIQVAPDLNPAGE